MNTASRHKLIGLTLGSIGVVYGDIGTSPLYAFRESLAEAARISGTLAPEMVIGLLSLILWTLIVVVTLKYVLLLLRADNHGEGGILSLMALAQDATGGRTKWVMMLGMAGASLFYGDAVITPAISVLSAVEGVKLVTETLQPYVVPIALVIMGLLFAVQFHGTEHVSKFFGPIMALWFVALAAGGIIHLADSPQVWKAVNPYHALYFLTHHGMASLIALGSVFLAVTGAEALYADLGHFGKKPIRLAWFSLVMPALILNYFGQAALVLAHPEAAENVFFMLYPEWALAPMVILATIATVIASQAVITGAFSLTHQAVQLGLMPRMLIRYTSAHQAGQIYIPRVNWLLLLGVIGLIEFFRSSSALAAAYGIAVTGTMVITALLAFVVMRQCWRWPLPLALAIALPLLIIDLTFLSANMTKLLAGGFIPILISICLILLMYIWVKGNRSLLEQAHDPNNSMERLLADVKQRSITRVEGTALYFTSNTDYAPSALVQNLKHNHVLHGHNYLLTLHYANQPYITDEERLRVEPISDDFTRLHLCYGYMEPPNVIRALRRLKYFNIELDIMRASFFISRRNIVPSAKFGMPLWQDHVFIAMANNASDAADYFHLPLSRVVELGVQMTV